MRIHRSSSADSFNSARLAAFLRPLEASEQTDNFGGVYGGDPKTFTKLLLCEALKSKYFADGFFGQEYNYDLIVDCDRIADLLCSNLKFLRSFFSLKVSIDMAKEILVWSPDFIERSFSSSVEFSSRFFEAIECLQQQKLVSVHGKSWAWLNLIQLPSECLSQIQCLDCSGQNIEDLPYKKLFKKFPSLQVLNPIIMR
jgi:hypothetical protein